MRTRAKGGRAEEEEHRPRDAVDDSKVHHRKSRQWRPPQLLALLVVHAVCLGLVVQRHHWLPEPVPASAPATSFSEERVRSYLNDIMQFGVRVVGSEANEVLTPAYLLKQVDRIKAQNPTRTIVPRPIQPRAPIEGDSCVAAIILSSRRRKGVIMRNNFGADWSYSNI